MIGRHCVIYNEAVKINYLRSEMLTLEICHTVKTLIVNTFYYQSFNLHNEYHRVIYNLKRLEVYGHPQYNENNNFN